VKDHPTLAKFSRDTGIQVTYEEVIEGNEPFFEKIAPRLKAGRPLGYDLIVLTNGWQLSQLIANRWVMPLDHSLLPNFSSYASPIAKNPIYDPGNRHSIPWQSGFTGIAYNTNKITRPITSVKDLWDPAFQGRVGMMSDNTDLGTAGMLYLGIDPASSTEADWRSAAAVLMSQRSRVRGYFDQRYIDAPAEWRDLDQPGLVGRHIPGQRVRPSRAQVHRARRGRHALDRQHGDPDERRRPAERDHVDELLLRAERRRESRQVGGIHHPGARRPRHPAQGGPGGSEERARVPDTGDDPGHAADHGPRRPTAGRGSTATTR